MAKHDRHCLTHFKVLCKYVGFPQCIGAIHEPRGSPYTPDCASTLLLICIKYIQFNFICIALFTIQVCHKAALQRALA